MYTDIKVLFSDCHGNFFIINDKFNTIVNVKEREHEAKVSRAFEFFIVPEELGIDDHTSFEICFDIFEILILEERKKILTINLQRQENV